MPLLRLETSAALPEDKRKALLASLSKAVAETHRIKRRDSSRCLMRSIPSPPASVCARCLSSLTSASRPLRVGLQVTGTLLDKGFSRIGQRPGIQPFALG